MNTEPKTVSMLQRMPVILAVTAASYGLQLPHLAARGSSQDTRSASCARRPAQTATHGPADCAREKVALA